MVGIAGWAGGSLWLSEADFWAWMVRTIQRRNDARFDAAVGHESRSRIEHALSDVGLSMSDHWVFAETSRHEREGGVVDGRLIVPTHMPGRARMFAFAFSTPYPWDRH